MKLSEATEPLRGKRGADYWRCLEELAEGESFRKALEQEFPQGAELLTGVDRRRFLTLLGASLALAGVGGCSSGPAEKIVPYVRAPEQVVPGRAMFFATAFDVAGYATGVVAESHMGRPTKIEGNPRHPASLGATDAWTQASVLSLYDPDRSRVVTHLGRISTWDTFLTAMAIEMEDRRREGGQGLRLLTGAVSSPSIAARIRRLLEAFPAARWHRWEPMGRHNARGGARLAFGRDLETRYRLEQADVVVSLGADLFGAFPGSVRYARDFMRRRKAAGIEPQAFADRANRLWVAEATPSITGSMADHRLTLPPGLMDPLARSLAARLGLGVSATAAELEPYGEWLDQVAADLEEHRGRAAVVAGEEQGPEVHATVHAMNDRLGNAGRAVVYTTPVEADPVDHVESIRELTRDMNSGDVSTLVVMETNPVLTAPADLEFERALAPVRTRIHHGLYEDETAELCQWHVPEAHYLETWGDSRAFDGTVSIVQPLIEPLYSGRSAHEVLGVIGGDPPASPLDAVRAHWEAEYAGADFDRFWERVLSDGVVPDTALPEETPSIAPAALDGMSTDSNEASEATMTVLFRPDSSIFDGRFANNGWLQELPRPFTHLTWENAALLSPATGERLGVSNGDVIELVYDGRSVSGPVWLQPGQADDTATLHVGGGRRLAGRVGSGAGFDAYRIRTTSAMFTATGVHVRPTGENRRLASTQVHHAIMGRDFVHVASLEEYLEHPDFPHASSHDATMSMYPEHPEEGYQWGMVIDTGACTGCNACVIACQSENNIPVVGREQVLVGREMHWIRVDSYYTGSPESPEVVHQPVPCMHCEQAPCEPVCPVGATVHSDDGLNDMVYNRCVGTRYCSNNCPYKVRRFNFLDYTPFEELPVLGMQANPDVTIRSRGVMEKCTYCVQRISRARIDAKTEDREIRDGEVVTACQAVCPTQAITFGNVNDPESRISELKSSPLNYSLLGELNTRPRTTYLGRVRNPRE